MRTNVFHYQFFTINIYNIRIVLKIKLFEIVEFEPTIKTILTYKTKFAHRYLIFFNYYLATYNEL